MQETEKILRVEHNIAWLPHPNESQLLLASHLPPPELVTTAFAVAFAADRLLMTNLRSRGWDLPGGHVESGEQPEKTVRREVQEEAGATLGTLHLLGYQLLRLLGPQPQQYRYPCFCMSSRIVTPFRLLHKAKRQRYYMHAESAGHVSPCFGCMISVY